MSLTKSKTGKGNVSIDRKSKATPKRVKIKTVGTRSDKIDENIRSVGKARTRGRAKGVLRIESDRILATDRRQIEKRIQVEFDRCEVFVNADRLIDILIVDRKFTEESYISRRSLVEPILSALSDRQFSLIISLRLLHPSEVG
jgi:hypothetical protein